MASLATEPTSNEKRLNARNAKKAAQEAAEMNTTGAPDTSSKTAQKMFWVWTVDKQFRGEKRTGYLIRDTSDTYLLDKDGEEIDQVYDGQEVYDEKGKILDLNDWFWSHAGVSRIQLLPRRWGDLFAIVCISWHT